LDVTWFASEFLKVYEGGTGEIPGGKITCQQVADLLTVEFGEVDSLSVECHGYSALGAVCGCPKVENTCSFCPDVSFPLDGSGCNISTTAAQQSEKSSDFCMFELNFFEPTCCDQDKRYADLDSVESGRKSGNDTCKFCWEETPFVDPDLDVWFWWPDLAWGYVENDRITCSQAADFLPTLSMKQDSFGCERANALGIVCGCESVENSSCNLCRNVATLIPDVYVAGDLCNQASRWVTQYRNGSESCTAFQNIWRDCCSDFDDTEWWDSIPYFGADTKTKEYALVWIPRVSGFRSLLGSSAIVVDVVRSRNNGITVNHSLVLVMSVFDIISSICWILSAAPIETPTWAEGAIGNQKTCRAQGFFYQLGYIGSISCNLTLSVYYLLVIVYNRREQQMKKTRPFLLGLPILIALSMACAGIPFYNCINFLCSIVPPPTGDSWLPTIFFTILPISTVFVGSSVIMLVIYCSVRKQTRAAMKWSMAARALSNASSSRRRIAMTPSQKMERAVQWQAFFYVGAFFVSWPVYMVGLVKSNSQTYALWVLVALLAPLQGFTNCLIYFRPRYVQFRARKRRERDARGRVKEMKEETETTGDQAIAGDQSCFRRDNTSG